MPLIKILSIIWLASNTLCILILLDTIAFGRPYFTMFLGLFGVMIYFNYERLGGEK